MAKIDHLFVLMLENRSFDHMLAFSGLKGTGPPPPRFGFKPGAIDQLTDDPPHEFNDVAAQIHGGAMDGFLRRGGPDTMLGFDETEVPVLIELARNNLVFDNWFSSVPGPTWPNRLFAHAASSGGLDNSMGSLDSAKAATRSEYHLNFEHGHIFDRLTEKGVSWRIYHHHAPFNIDYPQVLCLKGMVDKRNDPNFFRPFRRFAADITKGDVAGYTFIEPAYGLPAYSRGNSQHPTGTISLGEILIRNTYNAIFKQQVGANSALLITWDEHGGFFDHVTPPVAVPPGDDPLNHKRAKLPGNCKFDSFGVRVPAVLISPWLPAGLGSTIFGGKVFDHSSIVRALRTTFALGPALTNRDEVAPDWNDLLLTTPRALRAKLPAVAQPKFRAPPLSDDAVAARKPPDGNLLGVAQIAADIDWHTAERLHMPPLLASNFAPSLQQSHEVISFAAQGEAVGGPERAAAHRTVLQYIAAVEARDARLQTAPPPTPRGPRAAKKPVKKTAKKTAKKAAKKPTRKTAVKRPPPKASARKRKTRATRPRGAH
jgi:phospholipase C